MNINISLHIHAYTIYVRVLKYLFFSTTKIPTRNVLVIYIRQFGPSLYLYHKATVIRQAYTKKFLIQKKISQRSKPPLSSLTKESNFFSFKSIVKQNIRFCFCRSEEAQLWIRLNGHRYIHNIYSFLVQINMYVLM